MTFVLYKVSKVIFVAILLLEPLGKGSSNPWLNPVHQDTGAPPKQGTVPHKRPDLVVKTTFKPFEKRGASPTKPLMFARVPQWIVEKEANRRQRPFAVL